ncbi:MAG: hypothetical protein ACHRXM_19610 [Isosphaerales bacterium]
MMELFRIEAESHTTTLSAGLLQRVDMLMQVAQLGEPEVEAWQFGHAAEIDILVVKLTVIREGQSPPQDGPKPSAAPPSGRESAAAPPAAMCESQGEVSSVALDQLGEKTLPRSVILPSPPVVVGGDQGQRGAMAEPASRDRDRDRVVRVTAESLTRLMGLAGEALVQTHRLPPLVVSYKDREEDRIGGLDAGANAYLTKSSFHDQTFLTTVADLIGAPHE